MTDRSPLQTFAKLFGIVFLLVGILGFIPGITSNFDDIKFAGHESGAELLGIIQVSILENIVHLLYGIAGLAMARTWDNARLYFIGGGVIYLVLWIYGLVVDKDSNANFVPTNSEGDWLHFVLGVAMVGIGVMLGRSRDTTARTTTTPVP